MRTGVGVLEYWDLTLGEINLCIDTYNKEQSEKAKERVNMAYLFSSLTSRFVNLQLNGKKIPPIDEVFPALQEEAPQEQIDKAMALRRDQWIAFAEHHNKMRKQKRGEDLSH